MILLVGLGNKGAEYHNTRHNIGFTLIDKLFEDHNFPNWKQKFHSLITYNGNLILAKPMTYMNNSGHAIAEIMQFYKISIENITIIDDGLDLPVGEVRDKCGGGTAGHNGLKSISLAIGQEYHRIRIGIGRPEHKHDVSNYVLGPFDNKEQLVIDKVINDIMFNLSHKIEKS